MFEFNLFFGWWRGELNRGHLAWNASMLPTELLGLATLEVSFSEGLSSGLGSRWACFSRFQKNTCEKIARGIRPDMRLFQPFSEDWILPKLWAEIYLIIPGLNLILLKRLGQKWACFGNFQKMEFCLSCWLKNT